MRDRKHKGTHSSPLLRDDHTCYKSFVKANTLINAQLFTCKTEPSVQDNTTTTTINNWNCSSRDCVWPDCTHQIPTICDGTGKECLTQTTANVHSLFLHYVTTVQTSEYVRYNCTDYFTRMRTRRGLFDRWMLMDHFTLKEFQRGRCMKDTLQPRVFLTQMLAMTLLYMIHTIYIHADHLQY